MPSAAPPPFDERPAGRRTLNDVQEGRYDILLVYKPDRLGRDELETLLVIRQLKLTGVTVRSMT
jgi:DNA invertase Pin-like site-specific DNA recombinase